MPILRAGPFASDSASFLDVPATLSTSVAPVNHKERNSSIWPWRCVYQYQYDYNGAYNEEEIYLRSPADDLVESESRPVDERILLSIVFYYQSWSSWSFSGSSYNVSVDIDFAPSVPTEASVRVLIDGVEEYEDTDTGVDPSVSGDFDSVVFPAATRPKRVEIILFADAGETEEGALSAQITVPITQQ